MDGALMRCLTVLLFAVCCHAQVMQQAIVRTKAPVTGGGSTPAWLQGVSSGTNCSGGNPCTQAFGSNVTPGSTLFALFDANGWSAGTVTACGQTMTAVWSWGSTTFRTALYKVPNTTSSSCTVSVPNGFFGFLTIFEVSNMAGVLDGSSSNNATGTAVTSGGITTTVGGDLGIAVVSGATSSATTCTGLINKLQMSPSYAILIGVLGAADTPALACTISFSDGWNARWAAIKQ